MDLKINAVIEALLAKAELFSLSNFKSSKK